MRSMWKGAISFGLVMIPVKLYTATEQKDVAFRQVHRADGGRIRLKRVCSVCGEEVPFADVAKGYELPDGEMVVLTDDDLAQLPLPTARSIEVVHFSPADQLDPLLCGRSYYTEPEPQGLRAYALLRDALERSGKVGITRVALRQRESLAALRAQAGMLVLETLLWPDEVRTPDFAFLDQDVEVRPQELTMASSLISSMTVDFDPSEYRDGYRDALEELVAAKMEGHEVTRPPAPVPEGVGSLADALRASLDAAKSGRADGGRKRRAAAASSGRGQEASADGRRRRRAGADAAGQEQEEGSPDGGRRRSGPGGRGKKAGASGGDGKQQPRGRASA